MCDLLSHHLVSKEISTTGRAVAILSSDATSQDTLDGAAVEPFEDLRMLLRYA